MNLFKPVISMDNFKKKRYNIISHTIIVLFFILISFVINKIPSGTFIAGGDFTQLINLNNIKEFLYILSNQGGYNLIVTFPFYLFQSVLFNLGFSYSNIANTIIFIFLIGSFYSFYLAIKIIDKDIPSNIRLLSSGIYAINIFTFSIFTYPWGFTPFFFIYIFIPLLFTLFKKLISDFSIKNITFFIILFFIATVGFANPAFLAALFVLEILLMIIFFITKVIQLNIKNIGKILFGLALQLLLSAYFILPYFITSVNSINKLSYSKALGSFFTWILKTSPKIFSTLTFSLNESYPFNNLYPNPKIFIVISLGYIFFIVVLLLYQRKKQEKYWLHYFIFFVILFFLLMRLTPPFDTINSFIYRISFFKLFKSPDKFFVFYPFSYLILLSFLLYYSKFSRKIINAILIIILIIPVPFYIGGIPKYLTYQDQAGYRGTVQIPKEYYEVKDMINKDKCQLSIISLPYSVVNSLNWVNYPKWHYVGAELLPMIYNKLYISSNSYDHPSLETKLSFKEYNEAGKVDKEKFIVLLQKFSGKYIIFHKDITKDWIDNSKTIYDTVKALESDKILRQLNDNDYFTLYELNDNYLMPLISSSKSEIFFQKVSPIKYRIFIPNLREETNIEFHQSYDKQWRLFIKSDPDNLWCEPLKYYKNTQSTECKAQGKLLEIEDLTYIWKKPIFDNSHEMAKDYANSWTIDPEYIKKNYPEEYYKVNKDGSIDIEIVIYYKSQLYYYIGLIIAAAVFINIISLLIWERRNRNKI